MNQADVRAYDYQPRRRRRLPRPAPQRSRWRGIAAVGIIGAALVAAQLVFPTTDMSVSAAPIPTRAMFYYPWFPQTWHAQDHYRPSLGQYSSDDPAVLAKHVSAMRHAGMDAAIASWWGQGTQSERTRFPQLYAAAAAKGLGVIPYYESEGYRDTSLAQIKADLAYLKAYADAQPGAAVRIGGKPVIFVYNIGGGCAQVTKWKEATSNWSTYYVNMKVFGEFRNCVDQPSSWHQYSPAVAEAKHLPWSYNISPGFWVYNEVSPRLARDPVRWASNVAGMKVSGAQWQLVTSFNEWGEATSVEASPSWQTPSGMGVYLDELHRQLGGATPTPAPPRPSPTSAVPLPSTCATTSG